MRARWIHVDRRAHPDRVRNPARLQPRRLPDDDWRNHARPYLHASAASSSSPDSPSVKSQSYFDFFGGAFCYGCSYTGAASMTGAAGTLLAAYTATFGNGFTATIVVGRPASCAATRSGMPPTTRPTRWCCTCLARARRRLHNGLPVHLGDQRGSGVSRTSSDLRVDQAWGSAQIAGALHQLRAGYYGNNTTGAGANVAGVNHCASSSPRTMRTAGHVWRRLVIEDAVESRTTSSGSKAPSPTAQPVTSRSGGIVGTTNNYARVQRRELAAWADSVFAHLVSQRRYQPSADDASGRSRRLRALLDTGPAYRAPRCDYV